MVATDSSWTTRENDSSDREGWGNDVGFMELLDHARDGDRDALGRLLQWYTNYLTILASTQLDRRLRKRVNPSDIVQEAMLEAHQDFGDFRGTSQGELLCWLRTILIHTLHRSFKRHVQVQKRDIRREVSLEAVSNRLEESACNWAGILAGNEPSPSAPMRAREGAVELSNQLSKLKPHYREVIVLRVLQGLSFDEIAERMDRKCGAVRMLWLRALESFKASEDQR
ncbi:MAG TPA: RNA polymerase factor sigma-70 [Rhodopirellula baltica]|uniref:RNA polymerase sigma-E factor n=2 Tax=Rhodopirellula baltica TaxID=265606 RepID=L7CAQ6_RHOBT|nr:sigma-70 family RNA polymerase sigma factor [Rhodopirellula baltica]ELP31093.1 RNA polymerase sigma-E factor [Rhodopirellula baltica SWK14]CAD77180.1 probable RNA polymerase sigma-E factor [Rhodopirellula baltica SH 1]HBE64187.1 RNA polymerase factor sigma-70 [Rhodopirellula baltica]